MVVQLLACDWALYILDILHGARGVDGEGSEDDYEHGNIVVWKKRIDTLRQVRIIASFIIEPFGSCPIGDDSFPAFAARRGPLAANRAETVMSSLDGIRRRGAGFRISRLRAKVVSATRASMASWCTTRCRCLSLTPMLFKPTVGKADPVATRIMK